MVDLPGLSLRFRTATALATRPLDPAADDDDENSDDGPPAFSLAGELMGEAEYVPEFGEPRHLEVVVLSGDAVTDLRTVAPGRSYYIGPDVGRRRRAKYRDIPRRRRLAEATRDGAWITLGTLRGMLLRDGARQCLDLAGDVALVRPGDTVHLLAGDTSYHFRFVSPPTRIRAPPVTLRHRLRSVCWPAWGGALAFHLLALAVFGLFFDPSWAIATPGPVVEVVLDDRFSSPLPMSRTCSHPAPTYDGDLFPILCCLAEHDPPTYASDLEIGWTERKDGRARRVRVIPEPSPSALACVEDIVHRWRLPRRPKAERVRFDFDGVPTTPMPLPRNLYRFGQGHLERDAIQKVINANIGQIQRCYERVVERQATQPRKHAAPDLSGKLRMEWTIATTGRIRTARLAYSSLRSTEISECILGAIRTWQFPRPRDGEVTVTYPFIFRTIGF